MKPNQPVVLAVTLLAGLIVGHYAIGALEEIGAGSMPLLSQIQAARESPYDPMRRVAERLSKTLMAVRAPQPD